MNAERRDAELLEAGLKDTGRSDNGRLEETSVLDTGVLGTRVSQIRGIEPKLPETSEPALPPQPAVVGAAVKTLQSVDVLLEEAVRVSAGCGLRAAQTLERFHKLIGHKIADKYLVKRVLKVGGMGVVLLAEHVVLQQEVAIKMLLPALVKDEEILSRFIREAQVTARIKSEHVARIMDVGQLATGAPFVVMEYLEGLDLEDLLREDGQLPVARAVDIVLQATDAIVEAHSYGIVHRDLKPANIFLIPRNWGIHKVKVLDFGIVKHIGEAEVSGEQLSLTSPGHILGSPIYMSPEQLKGSKDVDQRADIWALGVIMYECIAGRRPFQAENVLQLSLMVTQEDPTPLSELRPDIPVALSELVSCCLAKDPAERFGSIQELRSALIEFATIETTAVWRVRRNSIPAEAVSAMRADAAGALEPLTAERPKPVLKLVKPEDERTPTSPAPSEVLSALSPGAVVERPSAERASVERPQTEAATEPYPTSADEGAAADSTTPAAELPAPRTLRVSSPPPLPMRDSARSVLPLSTTMAERPAATKRQPLIGMALAALLIVGGLVWLQLGGEPFDQLLPGDAAMLAPAAGDAVESLQGAIAPVLVQAARAAEEPATEAQQPDAGSADAEQPAAHLGVLAVATRPMPEIALVDGQPWTGQLDKIELSPGVSHRITLIKNGYDSLHLRLTLEAGETRPVESVLRLTKRPPTGVPANVAQDQGPSTSAPGTAPATPVPVVDTLPSTTGAPAP